MIHPILSPPRLVTLAATLLVSAFASPALADVVPDVSTYVSVSPTRTGFVLGLAFLNAVAGCYLYSRGRALRRPRRGPYRTQALREFVERRDGVLSFSARRSPFPWARNVLAAVLAVVMVSGIATFATGGCSPAVDAEIAADASAFAGALPVGCAIVNAVDGSVAGQVCGSVSSAVQGAAGILQGILNALSPATSKAPTTGPLAVAPPVVWVLGSGKAGVTVTIRADLAPQVVDAAKAKHPAKKGGGA